MKKPTQRDQNNIIHRHKREKSTADLAERYEVSERMIYKILKKYHETGCVPGEKKVARTKTKLSKEEEERETRRDVSANIVEQKDPLYDHLTFRVEEILKIGIDEYRCPEQIVTDNGSQYCTIRGGDPYNHAFWCFPISNGIRNIRSRISHGGKTSIAVFWYSFKLERILNYVNIWFLTPDPL